MSAVLSAILKAFGQLGDRAVIAVAVKSIAITLALFAAAGAGLYAILRQMFRSDWFASVLPNEWAMTAGIILWLVTSVVAFWLLFRVVAVMVLQFFADEVVAARDRERQPRHHRQDDRAHGRLLGRRLYAGVSARAA